MLLQVESPLCRTKGFKGVEKLAPKLEESLLLYERTATGLTDPMEIGEFVLHLNGASNKTKKIRRSSILTEAFAEMSTFADFVKTMCQEKAGTLEALGTVRMREAFDLFDGDKDEQITFAEFKVLCALGARRRHADGRGRQGRYGWGGLIDFQEVVAVMTKTDIAKNGGLQSSIAKYKKMFLLFDNEDPGGWPSPTWAGDATWGSSLTVTSMPSFSRAVQWNQNRPLEACEAKLTEAELREGGRGAWLAPSGAGGLRRLRDDARDGAGGGGAPDADQAHGSGPGS